MLVMGKITLSSQRRARCSPLVLCNIILTFFFLFFVINYSVPVNNQVFRLLNSYQNQCSQELVNKGSYQHTLKLKYQLCFCSIVKIKGKLPPVAKPLVESQVKHLLFHFRFLKNKFSLALLPLHFIFHQQRTYARFSSFSVPQSVSNILCGMQMHWSEWVLTVSSLTLRV